MSSPVPKSKLSLVFSLKSLFTSSLYSSNLNTIKGSQAYFKTCIDKVRVTHKCPLCARGYDSREGEEGLIRSVRTLLIHFLSLS